MKGIVIKSTGSWYSVMNSEKKVFLCRLKGNFRIQDIRTTNPIAVGDKVEFNLEANKNTGIVHAIEPRTNYIIRKSINLSKAAHIIAANIDKLYVVASIMNPRTSTGFIDRMLVTAEAYHIPAAIVFNKIDIYDKDALTQCESLIRLYEAIGYGCYKTSATENIGIEDLGKCLKDKTSLLSGHSGVGKSALINAIDHSLNLKVGKISTAHLKGMHTTTYAEMHPLAFGGFLIDSPGIKEFGLIHFENKEVAERFPEFRELLPHCKYNNCTHVHEPDCAVKHALSKGKIAESRYHNYLSILNDE